MGEDLDMILKLRRIPEPSSDFSARIIAEAGRHPQQRGMQGQSQNAASASGGLFSGLREWWTDFVEEFALPQPALVMSLVLLAGFVAGAGFGDSSASVDEDDQSPFGVVVLDLTDMEGLS